MYIPYFKSPKHQEVCFWAAALKGSMTYDSTQGNFLRVSGSPGLRVSGFPGLRVSVPLPKGLSRAPGDLIQALGVGAKP